MSLINNDNTAGGGEGEGEGEGREEGEGGGKGRGGEGSEVGEREAKLDFGTLVELVLQLNVSDQLNDKKLLFTFCKSIIDTMCEALVSSP